jgi:aromatic ring-cleaving dioxygenase
MLNRQAVDILIHPLADAEVEDHTTRTRCALSAATAL